MERDRETIEREELTERDVEIWREMEKRYKEKRELERYVKRQRERHGER